MFLIKAFCSLNCYISLYSSFNLIFPLGTHKPVAEKRDPFQGPRIGFYLSHRNEFSRETDMLTKQKTLLRGYLGSRGGKKTQENYSATWLAVTWFMVCRVSFRVIAGQSLWLKFLTGDLSITQPRWILARMILGRLVRHMNWCLLSAFDLSQILLVHGSLLLFHFLPDFPVVR